MNQLNAQKAAIYAPEVLAQLPRLLSMLDREPDSVTYGSFDRDHWCWKFRDFPITTLQSAIYPLALMWRYPFPQNPCYRNPRVLGWIEAAIWNLCGRQHPNGAFDSVGPYTQDHGVSLYVVYNLTETLSLLKDELPALLVDCITSTVRRSCQFTLQSSEDYAFITNHQAVIALALLNAGELLGDASGLKARAEAVIGQILQNQSQDGWYREYEGPDPGYESLGLFYLACYWQKTGSPRLLESMRRSVEFYAHCVHPDGSVGGIYGSRHTSLFYPAGFEILAAEIPMAEAVARFVRERFWKGNVVTLAAVDAPNLPSLCCAYLMACFDAAGHRQVPDLPCQTLDGVRHFAESGISAAGSPHYYAVIHAGKGGVCRIFDKSSGSIAYEDAGYLVAVNGRLWTSQLLGSGQWDTPSGRDVSCSVRFAEVRQEQATPFKFVVLRLLNLTLFRNLTLGAWVRRLILNRLILKRTYGPLRLSRSLRLEAAGIEFHDKIEPSGPLAVQSVSMPRAFTGIHMGSAKYFHSSEMSAIQSPPPLDMTQNLKRGERAERRFAVTFEQSSTDSSLKGIGVRI